ncbi:MAG: box helicase domain protein [Acidimicrobiaceae bacterium]|nr:box helicase domain protein [Acidimicrobiaceae bacterium]
MTPPRRPSGPRASGAFAGGPRASSPAVGGTVAGRKLSQLEGLPITRLDKVNERLSSSFAELGIVNVLELITHYPNRHEDRTRQAAIEDLGEGDAVSVVARVARVSNRRGRSRRAIVEVVLDDGTGRLSVTFFNQSWRARQLHEGMRVVAWGKVSSYRGAFQMANPSLQVVDEGADVPTGRLVPIYPESEKAGIGSQVIERAVGEALERAGAFADPLPALYRKQLALVDRTEAFNAIHAPASLSEQRAARRRLAFDELFRLQLALVMRKRAAAVGARGIAHLVSPHEAERDLVARFVAGLPFPLTAAQESAIGEISADLASPLPMHRLLQGDVGAGKTVVALAALLVAVQGGHQGALMVPTEVLAEQHFVAALGLLGSLTVPDPSRLGGERPVRTELLTSRTPAAERSRLVAALAAGQVDLLVGTHALITEDVRFASLGVVVIDEQHRFGVDQRAALREKGSADEARDPDLLVMTATPIPRTAAMTVYGDLDLSILDELPAGRAPVATRWVRELEDEDTAWAAVRAEVAAGHQAFVVCPLVRASTDGASNSASGGEAEEADPAEDEAEDEGSLAPGSASSATGTGRRPGRAAVEEAERLARAELADCRVGLLHGQLPPKEKESVMGAFRRAELDVLVATTVIEVGVDVASATVMVVEDADRFGIAQLHQLRGRVGRSDLSSRCFLLAPGAAGHAAMRLEALEQSNDGFELAEVDLDLRGEGTVLGARQKGRNDLKLASLRRDRDLVLEARRVAEAMVADDPTLSANPLLEDELRLFIGEEEAEYLLRS